RGILSPHIDYERGGFVYARVWAEAALSARKVQQVILLGTDHFSENSPFSLTHLDYSTPLGQLPTDQALVDACARILGERRAFEGELH
ncbi:MAG TPA: AmmeMemoRadiSam system protein B, partial [Anaerolinea sp.]|nr:AmmeMemoRadiSam system protein B [Anaerolinea sp.]